MLHQVLHLVIGKEAQLEAMSTGRKIELIKYRIHNQWISWLTSMGSSEPDILPEPLFDNRN